MDIIFYIVAGLLQLISFMTGLTYKEINIIVYYFAIPFAFIALLDRIYPKHFFKITFVIASALFFLSLKDFRGFSERLFDKSVEFLLNFKSIGWDYVTASVIVCVIIPVALFFVLRYYANRKSKTPDSDKDKRFSSVPETAMQKSADKEAKAFFGAFFLLALISIKTAGLGILFLQLPPFLIAVYGIILIWGLPLWRRLHLEGKGAPLVLLIVCFSVGLLCVKGLFFVFVAIGVAGMNP